MSGGEFEATGTGRRTARPGARPAAPRPVEVIIACHTPTRPVGRAVASVLDGNGEHAAVTVVCHDLPAAEIAAVLAPRHRDRVRYLEHRDGRRSASGPFNAGIAAAAAPFVAILGSDDQLAPGAVASWLAVQRRTGADLVLTRLALGDPGRGVPTPAARMHRRGLVDLVRDRLAYRSAPLGLLRREMLVATGVRLAEGATVGGDVGMVTRLMATRPTAYDRFGPPYVIGEDAGDRVTYVVRPLREQLGFLPDLFESDWSRALSPAARRAIGIKALRIHVFGAVFYRPEPALWTTAEREVLSRVTAGVITRAPGCLAPLSRADRDLVDACLDPSVPAEELIARARRRRRHGSAGTVLTRSWTALADREAPPRFMAASLAVKHLPRLAAC